ncbi:hypothetical protein BUALT_Bualt10G0098100 [Buddleja alternifolia]|uniref:Cytochrome P450 n=1 Tax=Buddleja alternifolia TaxID=168488 RepID=A0AAV6WXI6_9LAMI|nr:hypothetical protein BUALT_Bualt10G0098100 [Buddleja alternifolia]
MEFEFPSKLIVLVSFFLFIFIVLKLLGWNSTTNSSPLNLIPGPRKLPLIGNLHLLVGNPLPHRAFRDLADKYGPLMHLQLGEVPFIIVSSIEVAKQILKTHDLNFANRPPVVSVKTSSYNYTDIAFSPYGEYWRSLRKICILELLSARRVQSFRHIREEENRDLAKWIASNEGLPINMSERIYLSTYDITTRASLGKKTSEKGTFTSMIKEVVKLAGGLNIADLYPSIGFLPLITGIKFRIERMHQKTDRILNSIINEHRVSSATKTDDDEKTEDLADILLKYQEDGVELALTTDNVKAVLLAPLRVLWNLRRLRSGFIL